MKVLGEEMASERAFSVWVMDSPRMQPDRISLLGKLVEECEGSYGQALDMMLELASEQEDQRRRA